MTVVKRANGSDLNSSYGEPKKSTRMIEWFPHQGEMLEDVIVVPHIRCLYRVWDVSMKAKVICQHELLLKLK